MKQTSALDDAAEARIRELALSYLANMSREGNAISLPAEELRQAWQEGAAAERERVRAWKSHNPLGGPARDFEAMASRIRAGEPLEDVLQDFDYAIRARSGEHER